MFTDQRWVDFMPSLFSHHLLKDPGYNVAYWNLHERPLTALTDGSTRGMCRCGSSTSAASTRQTPWLLSRHQGDRPRILLSERPVLAALCEDYAAALDRPASRRRVGRPYGWEVSADGLADHAPDATALLVGADGAPSGPRDPNRPIRSTAARPDAFTAWLNAPDERGPRRWSRYLRAIYQARPDVQAHMPDIDGPSAARFGDWMRTDGVVQERIPPALAPPRPLAGARESCRPDRSPGPA